jgi:hypothetical protein
MRCIRDWPLLVQGLKPQVAGFGDDAIDYPLGLYDAPI